MYLVISMYSYYPEAADDYISQKFLTTDELNQANYTSLKFFQVFTKSRRCTQSIMNTNTQRTSKKLGIFLLTAPPPPPTSLI